MADYMMSARASLDSGSPGAVKFLQSTDNGATFRSVTKASWANAVLSEFPTNPDTKRKVGDILIFVHGFNVSFEASRAAHVSYRDSLRQAGWKGMLISFDWPSNGLAFAYLPDRENARKTANALVTDGVALLEQKQGPQCDVTVHVLCHSMGAFVTREAFLWAHQDVPATWWIGQLLFVAPDIEAGCMADGQPAAAKFVQHAGRGTVYWNRYDKALAVSDVKRLDLAPRLGRVGLPDTAPPVMSGVDCSALFDAVDPGLKLHLDPVATHCFYFQQPVFWQDVVLTLNGGIDRNAFPTRGPAGYNRFTLNTAPVAAPDYDQALKRSDIQR